MKKFVARIKETMKNLVILLIVILAVKFAIYLLAEFHEYQDTTNKGDSATALVFRLI